MPVRSFGSRFFLSKEKFHKGVEDRNFCVFIAENLLMRGAL